MLEKIEEIINTHVTNYKREQKTETEWKTPIISFASSSDPLFFELKKVVSKSHLLPIDLLPDAKTVISYFIPFENDVVLSNAEGNRSSRKWAVAYVETNKLIKDTSEHLVKKLTELNYESATIPPTHNFDVKELISDWSHRHVAYIAGLGRLGLNNMLITESGCGGRIGSLITNAKIKPTERPDKEYCLFYHNKTCKQCVEKCVFDALKIDSFNRHACYEICLQNAKFYSDLGLADVCGKCVSNVPCSFKNPVMVDFCAGTGNRGGS